MKLLIVEDEKKSGEYLKKGLIESNFVVDLVNNGLDGLHQAMTEKYDLIILDVMLPKLNGWQILQTLRSSQIIVPVLILTARDQLEDRVKGLELGADDYLVKPFAFIELVARIRCVLRRNNEQNYNDTILRVENLQLNLLNRRVYRDNVLISLTRKEFLLLELLMRRKGIVLSRSSIASEVWDMNFDSDTNVIDVAIRRLRNKVDKQFEPKLIHTIRGVGYVLDIIDDNAYNAVASLNQ
ncbi:heavy metal response regulator transcription factor [Vibrio sp. DW001]|uniref:heavy metal response regulator transcription factor n=1 Tax=Vibrio sp. DW001 TaxID=2912315 RepID=UPI0023B0D5DF|nr:heavy metal response regulator transcription factor [Vibrio sp. DW001]WED25215.1 heavy metal response regulator transcription factor [Vibrio sp. DW001]